MIFKKFKDLGNQFKSNLNKTKKQFYWRKFYSCIGDSRQTFKLLNYISGKHLNPSIVPALDSCIENSATEIAETFNKYFTTIAQEVSKTIEPTNLPKLPKVEKSMFLYDVSESEIKSIIDNLDNKSSSGDDLISNLIIKASSDAVIPYLTYILVIISFQNGEFPEELRKAKVLPLHKDGPKTCENNYRPISLLIIWSKIFERTVYVRMYDYLDQFSLLYTKQYGFRSKHCTIDALVDLLDNMRVKNKNMISFCLDLRKAFDTLEHPAL